MTTPSNRAQSNHTQISNTQLRRILRARRRSLPIVAQYHAARAAARALPTLARQLPPRANIALYAAEFGELPTEFIAAWGARLGYRLFLPVVAGNHLKFAPISYRNGRLFYPKKRHKLGMNEPRNRLLVPAAQLHAIFCPLVAFNDVGARMGMGGGFYDRTLTHFGKSNNGLKIGLAYDFQRANFDENAWDIRLDWVITEHQIYRF